MQFSFDSFYTKRRLSQDLLPDMELLPKRYPTLSDIKNGYRAQKIFSSKWYRMNHFDISVTAKRNRDNKFDR